MDQSSQEVSTQRGSAPNQRGGTPEGKERQDKADRLVQAHKQRAGERKDPRSQRHVAARLRKAAQGKRAAQGESGKKA